MKAMKWLGIALLALVVLFVGMGLFGSKDYALARSIVIQAPPEVIHPYLADLRKWSTWVPWEQDDPSLVTTYGEVSEGVGATQSWTSDEGPGRLEMTRADVTSGIAYEMVFGEGDSEMPATCQMNYRAVDGGTQVIWEMQGSVPTPVIGPWLARAMDGLVGPTFEQGLSTLKDTVEGKPAGVPEAPAPNAGEGAPGDGAAGNGGDGDGSP